MGKMLTVGLWRTLFLCGALVLTTGSLVPKANAAEEYGPWHNMLDHPGFKYRLRCENCRADGAHMWWIQFENDSPQRASFSYRIVRSGQSNVIYTTRVTIDPDKTAERFNSVEEPPCTVGNCEVGVQLYTEDWKFGPNA